MAKNVAVIGAGAWGTTIGKLCAENGHQVKIWAYLDETVQNINLRHENERLEGLLLPDTITASTSMPEVLQEADLIVVGLASEHISILEMAAPYIPEGCPLLVLTKGLVLSENSFFVTDYIQTLLGACNITVLSGPNIAREIAEGKPAATVISGDQDHMNKDIQALLSNDTFRVYRALDRRGVECGGIFKNVIAIAAGICDGLNLGDNAKASLISRGIYEIQRLSVYFGGDEKTVFGLSGIGDLMTTCLSPLSRNRSFGEAISKTTAKEVMALQADKTVEGVRTVKILMEHHQEVLEQCPIMMAVYHIIYNGASPEDELLQLMTRALKEE